MSHFANSVKMSHFANNFANLAKRAIICNYLCYSLIKRKKCEVILTFFLFLDSMDDDSGLILDENVQFEQVHDIESDFDRELDHEQVHFEEGTTARGAKCLWYQGWRYLRMRINCPWFRCEKRSCPATVKLENAEQMCGILGSKEHCCGVARQAKKNAECGRQILRERMQNEPTLKKGRTIAQERQQQTDDATVVKMGTNNALRKMMCREDKKKFGQLNVANPLNMEFPDDLVYMGEHRVLIYDSRENENRPGQGDAVLVFSHPQQLELLRRYSRWAMDGTHSVTPNGWSQTFVVGCFVRRKLIVCGYALLPGHNKKYYKEALQAIVYQIREPVNNREVIIDMELAIKKAVEEVLPDAHLTACFFHFTQALVRKWRKMGIDHRFGHDPVLMMMANDTLRNLMALALIPVEHVQIGLQQCAQFAPHGMDDFIQYFARTYVGLTAIPNRWDIVIIIPPRFNQNFWNVNSRARLAIEKTNNPLEIQHKHFSMSLQHHPPMTQFLRALLVQIDVQLDSARYWQLHPDEASKPSKKKYSLKEEALLAILDSVDYYAPMEPHWTLRTLAHQMVTYIEALPTNQMGRDSDEEHYYDYEE